jgi:hypothetical protein
LNENINMDSTIAGSVSLCITTREVKWLQLHEEPVSLTWLLFLYNGITKVRLMCTHKSGDKGSEHH